LGAAAALYTLIHRPDLAGLGLLESTSLQIGNGQFIRDTAPLPVGPLRISIGVGAAEMGPEISKSLGLPGFDAGFAKLSEILAANMRAALFNHPEVLGRTISRGRSVPVSSLRKGSPLRKK
jgi:hypothetical protein